MTRDGAPLGYDRHEICVSLLKIAPSRFLVVATGLLALAIFIVDTATPFGFAVAVLYVLVILLAASFCRRRDVLLASAGCMVLTALSYFISHGTGFVEAPLARAFMSLSAIGGTTLLALRYQSAVRALRAQGALLDLTHDTVFVHDMNNVITYWNRGAEEQYGWTREEAAGRVTSELLQAHFPEPLETILAGLLRTGRWDGELVHTRRDGTKAVVASRGRWTATSEAVHRRSWRPTTISPLRNMH